MIEYRSADGHDERFPKLAAELVGMKVDLILARSNGHGIALPLIVVFIRFPATPCRNFRSAMAFYEPPHGRPALSDVEAFARQRQVRRPCERHRRAKFFDGVEGPHPQQVLLQGSDEALCDAVTLGLSHEGGRSFDPQAFDFVLEVAGHVVGAMIVRSFNPRATPGAIAPKQRCTPCRTGSRASKRLADRDA